MDPAERVFRDPELASAIGDDDCTVQKPLFGNRAPQRGFGCDLDRIGLDRKVRKAEFLQMGHEGFAASEALLGVPKTGDSRQGQIVLAHIIEGGPVDDVVVAPSPEQREKIQPAL